MNSKQEAKMSMYDAVINHCNDNGGIIATVPAFETALTAFSSKYSSLVTTAQLEMNAISGITMDKAVLRKNLAQQAADIAAAIFAYASSINNNELREQVRYPFSKLTGLKDELLAPACQNIHNVANDNIASLAAYSITPATLSSFQDAIEDYSDVIPAPRNATSQRVAYAAAIKNLFSEADDIAKNQLDKIAPQFKAENLEFYNTYKNNRVILDAAVSNTQVTGIVTNAYSEDPIPGVTIEFVGQPISAITGLDGTYTLKNPIPGIYSIKASMPEYQDNTVINVELTLGQSTTVDISLVPIPT